MTTAGVLGLTAEAMAVKRKLGATIVTTRWQHCHEQARGNGHNAATAMMATLR